MRIRPIVALGSLCAAACTGQPYLDVGSAQFVASPDRMQRIEVALSLPISVGDRGDRIVLSPFWEEWRASVPAFHSLGLETRSDRLTGIALPITWVHPFRGERWKVLLTGIARQNDAGSWLSGDAQWGGALLVNYAPRKSLTWKAGLYMNGDAFGLFWLPLLGIDWRLGPKHNIWGVLHGTMHYEHKLRDWFHWGAAFRAFTNSYGPRSGNFRRVDENMVGLFGDVYLLSRKVVLRLEVGHTALSQYQGGPGDPYYAARGSDGYVDHGIGNGLYVKTMLAYRVRLDGKGDAPKEPDER